MTLNLFQARFVSLQTPKWTLSEKIRSLGVADPNLARARGWMGGEVICLCALAQSSLTPLPSPPGEGPSTPGGFPRFQLIQDFSVNYNRVWTPALPLLSCFPLAPFPKCEPLPKRAGGGGAPELGAEEFTTSSWEISSLPTPYNLGGFPKLNHNFSYIYICIYI